MEELKKGLIISCFAIISLLSINVAYAQYGGGGGGYAGDYSAPMISNINVAVTDTGATITWITNESSISWVVYGTSTNYGLEVKTTSYVTSHSVTLTGLSPATTYHYQVKSKDILGNIGTYTDKTFTTLALGAVPEVKPPVVVKPVTEMTIEELRTEINRLIALISQLQSQLAKVKIVGIPTGFLFQKSLSSGMSVEDVIYLKIILGKEGCLKGVKNTKYFGSQTLAGVKCLCQKYKTEISQTAGYEVQCSGLVGKGIIAKLNQLIK